MVPPAMFADLLRRLGARHVALPLFAGLVMTIGLRAWLSSMGVSVQTGDILGYIEWSYHPWFHTDYPSHLPLLPTLLFLGRALTFRMVSDVMVATALAAIAWMASTAVVDRILEDQAPRMRPIGVALWSLAPLTGIRMIVYPGADQLGCLLLALAALGATERRAGLQCVATAIGLFSHQALWLPFGLMALFRLRDLGARSTLLTGLPILAYYAAMAVATGRWNWVLAHHRAVHGGEYKVSAFGDAIWAPLLAGGWAGWAKAGLMLGIVVGCLLLLARQRKRGDAIGIAWTLPILLYALLTNERSSFIVVRYVRLLALPLALAVALPPPVLRSRSLMPFLWVALLASQGAYAAYTFSGTSAIGPPSEALPFVDPAAGP